jgi:P2-related tail formation protein
MTSPAIIEAAARALFEAMERLDPELDDPDWEKLDDEEKHFFRVCVRAVTPRIEAATLEKAAKVAEEYHNPNRIAAEIRALITKDSGGGD